MDALSHSKLKALKDHISLVLTWAVAKEELRI